MGEDSYTSAQVARLTGGVALHTVHRWAIEFQRHLSPSANPPKGKQRNFTRDDLGVLLVVAQLKRSGLTHSEVHAALDTGERADIPSDLSIPSFTPQNEYQRQIVALTSQVQALQIENAVLKAQLDEIRRQGGQDEIRRLERLIGGLDNEIKTLKRQLGDSS